MRRNFVLTKASTTTNESCLYHYDDTLYKNLEAFLPDLLPQHLQPRGYILGGPSSSLLAEEEAVILFFSEMPSEEARYQIHQLKNVLIG